MIDKMAVDDSQITDFSNTNITTINNAESPKITRAASNFQGNVNKVNTKIKDAGGHFEGRKRKPYFNKQNHYSKNNNNYMYHQRTPDFFGFMAHLFHQFNMYNNPRHKQNQKYWNTNKSNYKPKPAQKPNKPNTNRAYGNKNFNNGTNLKEGYTFSKDFVEGFDVKISKSGSNKIISRITPKHCDSIDPNVETVADRPQQKKISFKDALLTSKPSTKTVPNHNPKLEAHKAKIINKIDKLMEQDDHHCTTDDGIPKGFTCCHHQCITYPKNLLKKTPIPKKLKENQAYRISSSTMASEICLTTTDGAHNTTTNEVDNPIPPSFSGVANKLINYQKNHTTTMAQNLTFTTDRITHINISPVKRLSRSIIIHNDIAPVVNPFSNTKSNQVNSNRKHSRKCDRTTSNSLSPDAKRTKAIDYSNTGLPKSFITKTLTN